MPDRRSQADEVILINAFEVPAQDAETFIAAWEKTRDYPALYQVVRT